MSSRNAIRAMAFGMFCLLLTPHTVSANEILASVSGQITVNGQPLPSGRVFFILDDDQFVGSKVKDGAFTVKRVPVGVCQVAFEGEGVPAKVGGGKSPFKVNVEVGKNQFDFDVKGQ